MASSLKINAVVMRGVNEHEIEPLMLYAHDRGMDLTLIETMPIGLVDRKRETANTITEDVER